MFFEYFFVFSVGENSEDILVWQQIQMPHFVSVKRNFLIS